MEEEGVMMVVSVNSVCRSLHLIYVWSQELRAVLLHARDGLVAMEARWRRDGGVVPTDALAVGEATEGVACWPDRQCTG